MLFTLALFFVILMFLQVWTVGGGATFPFFANNVLSATNIPIHGVFVEKVAI